MDWLKTIAPTVATALGGPLAGMAVSAIAKAIGCSPDEVQDVISSGKLKLRNSADRKMLNASCSSDLAWQVLLAQTSRMVLPEGVQRPALARKYHNRRHRHHLP